MSQRLLPRIPRLLWILVMAIAGVQVECRPTERAGRRHPGSPAGRKGSWPSVAVGPGPGGCRDP